MTDYELIYLFIVIKNQWAFNFLYHKYHSIINLLARKKFYQFFSLPLELSDLQSITYDIFYQSVVSFQISKNKSFKNFLLTNLDWGLLKYFKKYLTKNHQILNLATKFQDYCFDDSLGYQDQFYQVNLTNLLELNNLKLSFSEKNVLKLKHQGYSNQEIMAKLNLSYKQVDNAFQRVTVKLKQLK